MEEAIIDSAVESISATATTASKRRRLSKAAHDSTVVSQSTENLKPLTFDNMFSYEGDPTKLYETVSEVSRRCLCCGTLVDISSGRDWNWLMHLARRHTFMLSKSVRDTALAQLYKSKGDGPSSAAAVPNAAGDTEMPTWDDGERFL